MSDCLFCKIIAGDIPSKKILETDNLIVIDDIAPQAPVHFLIIPKKHISTTNDINEEDKGLIGDIYLAAKRLAKEKNIDEDGYRVVVNCNKNGGQAVYHIHYHLLGGRVFTWPPG